MNAPVNCILYIRFSTKRQETGASRERQLEDCHAYAARQGWNVTRLVEDLGRSAWSGDHLNSGNLGTLANEVRAGEIPAGTIILTEKLDRLSRMESRITRRWMEDMTDAGVLFATVSPGKLYDRDTFGGSRLTDFLEILLGAKAAHDYSENLSDKVTDGWEKKISREKYDLITRKVPGWITVTKEGQRVCNHHAASVVKIYQLAADGLGVRMIAKRLNDDKVPTWGRTSTWDQSNVRFILTSPAAEGDYLSGGANPGRVKNAGVFHPGYYERAVPADLVAKAREKMAGRKLTGGRESGKAVNLFSGLILCDHCGSRMYLRTLPNKSRVYQCSDANQRRGCSHNETFRYDAFEAAALDVVLTRALDDRHFKRPDDSLSLVHQVAAQKKAIADAETLAGSAYAIYLKHPDNPMAEARFEELSAALKTAKASLGPLEEALAKARGWVSPAEHARRVMEIRDAIASPDKVTREAARLKVMDALKGVVAEVRCNAVDTQRGEPERTFSLTLVGGMIGAKFDNAGNVIAEYDLTENLTTVTLPDGTAVDMAAPIRAGMLGGDPKLEATLDAVLRRQEAAASSSSLTGAKA
ncbi:MAG: recombinase family protein [Brevundimonas sp.]|uniref:recombinase family protein n=1 Tax=Brevundimonas sp. TaxID=1871086 RepID=UPI00272482A2|nr:recombinase family protein [Brevundimonas sp.]MDO9607356.1 recombinase family protein [Brevundimonas sp.]